MSPSEKAAWSRLSPEERSAFDQLHRMAANGEARSEDLAATDPASGKANTHAMMQQQVANARQLLTNGGAGDYARLSAALERSGGTGASSG